jgi:predicted dinucleotide-binding enzyme
MRIAVLGTGTVGQLVAERLGELGHDVVVGTRDVNESLSRVGDESAQGFGDWARSNGRIRVAKLSEAAAGADVVVNATSGEASLAALALAGDANLAGQVLIDVSNPLDFSQGFPPTLFVSDTDSLGEQIQSAFPGARVVKALNTVNMALAVRPQALAGGEHTVFVCGDDETAKATVIALLQDMGHRDVLDLGGISSSRGTEMYLALWTRLMVTLGTGTFNIKVVR